MLGRLRLQHRARTDKSCTAGTDDGRGTGRSERQHDRDKYSEVYHVREKVWKAAKMEKNSGCLCIGCLEKRIKRAAEPEDFPNHPLNGLPGSERLLEQRGEVMTPLAIIAAALFGGLCWTGSRPRRYYVEPYIDSDVNVACDDACGSDDCQDSAPVLAPSLVMTASPSAWRGRSRLLPASGRRRSCRQVTRRSSCRCRGRPGSAGRSGRTGRREG